ncbi:hypothetical protein TNCV_1189011 [Trichonephila clavipes]|nr:hypothetical protein TNCV_1189011 [Trichonephila clavipes]
MRDSVDTYKGTWDVQGSVDYGLRTAALKQIDGSIGAPDLRRDLNLLSEHLGNSIEILYLPLLQIKVEKISTGLLDFRGHRATEDHSE